MPVHATYNFCQLCMYGFVSNRGRDIGKINFISCSCTEGASWVREVCSWQDYVFTASKVSHVNGWGGLLKNFLLCSCEEEYGINSRPGEISWDLFFGLLEAMVQWGAVPTGMESKQLFTIGF